MTRIVFGERRVTVEDVAAASTGGVTVGTTPELRARMQQARKVLDTHLEQGVPVYGLNTGLGGNIGHRIAPDEAAELQAQLVLARVAGVGDPLPLPVCRAVL